MADFVNLWYSTLIENNIATEEEIFLVCSINGQNEQSFLDIVYSRTGLRSWEQLESEGYYVPTLLLYGDLEEYEDD